MNDRLDRNELISILETLGSENDEEVLAAARVLHAKVVTAGTSWDTLLTSDEDEDEAEDFDPEEDDEGTEDLADLPGDAAEKNAESLALIGKMLARSDLSDEFRQELEDYKTDIAEDEFEDKDHSYIRAVYKRLSA